MPKRKDKNAPLKRSRYSRRIQRLLARHGHKCWLCGRKFKNVGPNSKEAPSIDHVVSKHSGGWDHPDNYRLAHRSCNSARHHRFPGANIIEQQHIEKMREELRG